MREHWANEQYFLDQFEQERGTCDFVKTARLPRARARATQFFVASRLLKMSALTVIALVVVGYIGLQVREIVAAPELLVMEPADGFMTDELTVKVTGQAKPGVNVEVNGADVILKEDGSFETEVVLERQTPSPSKAQTLLGSKVDTRHVVLQQERSTALPPHRLESVHLTVARFLAGDKSRVSKTLNSRHFIHCLSNG